MSLARAAMQAKANREKQGEALFFIAVSIGGMVYIFNKNRKINRLEHDFEKEKERNKRLEIENVRIKTQNDFKNYYSTKNLSSNKENDS